MKTTSTAITPIMLDLIAKASERSSQQGAICRRERLHRLVIREHALREVEAHLEAGEPSVEAAEKMMELPQRAADLRRIDRTLGAMDKSLPKRDDVSGSRVTRWSAPGQRPCDRRAVRGERSRDLMLTDEGSLVV
jgi:hypothetical protein